MKISTGTLCVNGTHVVVVLFDDGLVKANGLLELGFLHEEYVGHVEFPHIMLITEFHRFPKYLLHLLIILHIPIDLGLLH